MRKSQWKPSAWLGKTTEPDKQAGRPQLPPKGRNCRCWGSVLLTALLRVERRMLCCTAVYHSFRFIKVYYEVLRSMNEVQQSKKLGPSHGRYTKSFIKAGAFVANQDTAIVRFLVSLKIRTLQSLAAANVPMRQET